MNNREALLAALKTTYALVDARGRIIAHAPSFPAWAGGEGDSLVGQALSDVLPEFLGQEEALEEVRRGDRPFVRLEYVHRPAAEGERYLTLTAIPGEAETGAAWTVLLTDITEQAEHYQELTQSRNELRLLRRRLDQRNAQLDYLLRHYLPSEVADALLKGELRPEPGGEVREVSILFADVRGFTPLAERVPPERLVQLLNGYFNVAVEAIEEGGGTVCQFQGDGLMAIFQASAAQPDHARRAVQSGIALQRAVGDYQRRQPAEEPRLHFGVGIHSGPALVGNIGARWLYNYTAIGDTTNLAARITAATPAGQIWVSEATYGQLDGTIAAEALPPMHFKGKERPVGVFRVRFE